MTQNGWKILVVDDDSGLRELVANLLDEEGYTVATAENGSDLPAALRNADFDLIILDIMLPGQSGLDLCVYIRQTSTVPIMILTARGGEADRIVGLEIGADDYLTKPFSSRELLARIKALLRRANNGHIASAFTRRYKFEGWILDVARHELASPESILVQLTTGEYDLLRAFVEAPQRVLTRDQLLDLCRGQGANGFDRSIDVQISRLRRKLAIGSGEDIIKTVRGAGYMFVPSVSKI